MTSLLRIALVRHGETVGESRVRYFGSTDVPLSREGRVQALAARHAIPGDRWDDVVSSTLARAWQTARIVARGRPVALEHDFREICFGRWEGLTREEIAARDPELYAEWQQKGIDFDYPDGGSKFCVFVRINADDLCISREGFHPNGTGTTAYADLLKRKLTEIGYQGS